MRLTGIDNSIKGMGVEDKCLMPGTLLQSILQELGRLRDRKEPTNNEFRNKAPSDVNRPLYGGSYPKYRLFKHGRQCFLHSKTQQPISGASTATWRL